MATAPLNPPALGSIGRQLTSAEYQSIADQLRRGGTNVTVAGKTYGVYQPQFRSQILAQYPAAPAETTALGQMAKVDPASEALRQQLAGSYATPLSQAQAPSAGQLQSYLDIYRQIDPTAYAGAQALGSQVMGNVALGSQLDPITQMQLQQQVRAAQGARGNVYGTPQLVEEAMTTGQAGLALQQQREQAAQSYLQSGVGLGSTALNMYQQNLANLRAAQQGAQSYLASGVTPYQAGAGYLGAAQQAGAAASAGGPVYQPAALGSPYSYLNPQYGQQTSATWLGYFQALQNQYAQNYAMNRSQGGGAGGALAGGLSGALSGAVGGATLGSVIPGVGTLVGAGIGALAGGGLGAIGGYSR